MSLAKFIDFAMREALYFSNLAFAEDPYDGIPSGGMERHYLDISGPQNFQSFRDSARRGVCVSCWHLSQYEPASMWKLYAASDAGIALKTTYRALRDSFHAFPTPIYLGLVRYNADTWKYRPDEMGHTLAPTMLKRVSFQHEHEVRAISWKGGDRDSPGHHVEVDLSVLAPEVVVGPAAPAWAFRVVEGLVNRLGHQWSVRQSDLYVLPPLPEKWESGFGPMR